MKLLGYAAKTQADFSQLKFNRIDALILSWLAYFTYPDTLKGGGEVALKDLEKLGLLPDGQMYAQSFNPKRSKKLFDILKTSPRFGEVKLSRYTEERDAEREIQFAAVCIRICENDYYLAFRGTDPSFVGWKEDFNLACTYPIPSQSAAVEYVTARMRERCGTFILGGHSKGGNVAEYAAANVSCALQDRVVGVYNFDGPADIGEGFMQLGYLSVADRIQKIVPQSSFVGMLFETRNRFAVVKSGAIGFFQHDPFSWKVKENDFIFLRGRKPSSVRLARSLNKWVHTMSIGERERVITLVYGALNTLDTDDFNVFFKTVYRQVPALYRAYKNLHGDDRTFFNEKIKIFRDILVEETKPIRR